MIRGIVVALAMGWMVVAGGGTAAAQTQTQTLTPQAASALVDSLTRDAVTHLSVKGLSHTERVQAVRDLITRYSNEEHLAAQILGSSWATTPPEEKAHFEKRLTDYLVAICSGMLKGISADTKVIVKGEETMGDRIVVHTVIRVGNEPDPTPVDWSVAATADGHLFLADAAAEGVSMVRTMTSDFRAVLYANGGKLSALVDAMNKKITLADTTD